METYKYKDYEVTLSWNKYLNGNTALSLDSQEGVVADVSVNIEKVDKDLLVVKNYSENVGMDDFLLENGLVESKVLGKINSGFISAPVYKLSKKAIELRDKEFEQNG